MSAEGSPWHAVGCDTRDIIVYNNNVCKYTRTAAAVDDLLAGRPEGFFVQDTADGRARARIIHVHDELLFALHCSADTHRTAGRDERQPGRAYDIAFACSGRSCTVTVRDLLAGTRAADARIHAATLF